MNPLIKWPGGKSSEINKIAHLIPKYNRYIEPFFGGGALFFHLNPENAEINDISQSLIDYYNLLKIQDKELYNILISYNNSFSNILKFCNNNYFDILKVYNDIEKENLDKNNIEKHIEIIINELLNEIDDEFYQNLILDSNEFESYIIKMVSDKMLRTISNNIKKQFSETDLKNNLITGFTSGYYMYFRKIYNDINLRKINIPSLQYKVANFYFIREYCYGSMFRYNAKGEFNIPYGGISYNNKNFKLKIENMFNEDVKNIFKNTKIHCSDFSDFLKNINLTTNDFIFLDPPYDTDFSDYEGKAFTQYDQERLAYELKNTDAKFILVIKNTDFIKNLYEKDFNILSFNNQYSYNVRSRNKRDVEHLIITNLPI